MTENHGFIAVHCGAGTHKNTLQPKYKKVCKEACLAAGKILKAGGTAVDACEIAVMMLEENPVTNAGYGSNLTITGQVECDASMMDGETLNFGACGAVKGVKYPISLATKICVTQSNPRPLGLICPTLLVGEGATTYAKENNLILIDNKKLISQNAYLRHKKHKTLLKQVLQYNATKLEDSQRLDTVGAICVDGRGHTAAASSSGGIFLQHDGRVGQAATYACGTWADSINNKDDNSVAVSTTGTGEYLVKTMLAKEIGEHIKNSNCPVTTFQRIFKEKFLESRYVNKIATYKHAGALALHVAPSGEGELIWGYSTKSLGLAYMDTIKMKPRSLISSQTRSEELYVTGVNFKLKN